MSEAKKALIFGATGQDGSYLSELLLEKGYKVYGSTRQVSVSNLGRVVPSLQNPSYEIVQADITDASSVSRLIKKIKPDEIYNLAAQSAVQISFDEPCHTFDVTAKGCLNILEAIRTESPNSKFFQASSSEMFGGNYTSSSYINENLENIETRFQNEWTPFNPRSPYSVAKLAAHNFTKVYRESYKLFACSGIMFNHETLTYGTPLIIKTDDGLIDILPIGDIARYKTGINFDLSNMEYQEGVPTKNLEVWDKNGWVKVKFVSGYPHKGDKNPKIINARNSVYSATGSHMCIMEDDSEIKTEDLKIGDKVANINYPEASSINSISMEEAEFLGMMAGDGNLDKNLPRFTNKDLKLKERFIELWNSFSSNPSHRYHDTYSGFNGVYIGQVICNASGNTKKEYDLYTSNISVFGHKLKKVPKCILNSDVKIMEAFLIGYNNCDGLKAGYGKYRFKNFKTNSMTLAAGLIFLISKVTGQKYNITVEESNTYGKKQYYYSINLLSKGKCREEKRNNVRKFLNQDLSISEISRRSGCCRKFVRDILSGKISKIGPSPLCSNEIKKIVNIDDYNGWFFDLETESGTFHAGIGQGLVHNSPRRGENFVTRKITRYIGDLLNSDKPRSEIPKLKLGNLDVYRDWGHAKDVTRAMWLMLNAQKSKDYVIATGVVHSLKDFLNEAFSYIGYYWKDYVEIDPKLFRLNEVPYCQGNYSFIKEDLGWEPTISFKQLVREMVNSDSSLEKRFK